MYSSCNRQHTSYITQCKYEIRAWLPLLGGEGAFIVHKLCIPLIAFGFGGSLGIMLIYAIVLNLCLVALRVRRKCFTANYFIIFIFYDNNRILVSEEIAMGVKTLLPVLTT